MYTNVDFYIIQIFVDLLKCLRYEEAKSIQHVARRYKIIVNINYHLFTYNSQWELIVKFIQIKKIFINGKHNGMIWCRLPSAAQLEISSNLQILDKFSDLIVPEMAPSGVI